jgi:hypothetical protein
MEAAMGKINWGRVFLGGLAGGVIVLVIDILVNGVLFGAEWKVAFEKLGNPPTPSGLIVLAAWALLVGISIAWLYAAAGRALVQVPRQHSRPASLSGFSATDCPLSALSPCMCFLLICR